jgi:hypothetical protein
VIKMKPGYECKCKLPLVITVRRVQNGYIAYTLSEDAYASGTTKEQAISRILYQHIKELGVTVIEMT